MDKTAAQVKQSDSGIVDIAIKTTEFGTEGAGIDMNNATQETDLERQLSGEEEKLDGTIDPVEGTARE